MGHLKGNKYLAKLIDNRFSALERELLTISPIETDKFTVLTSQRLELGRLLKEMMDGISMGAEAKRQLDPEYTAPKPHMV